MKRTLAVAGLILMVGLDLAAQGNGSKAEKTEKRTVESATEVGSEQEKEFKTRLEAFQKAGNMAVESVRTVYQIGDTPGREMLDTYQHLEAVVVRGIKAVKFEDIFPVIRESLKQPIEIH